MDDHGGLRRFDGRRAEAASDADLVAAIAAGERSALAEVFAREGGRILAAARARCGPHRAEDVVHDVLIELWQRPDRYDPARGTLGNYLLLRARSRSIDAMRSDGARVARERSADARLPSGPGGRVSHVEDEVLGRLASDAALAALRTVPPRAREAIALAVFGGRTYREVAALLGRPEGTVKSQIRSGLTRLRAALEVNTPDASLRDGGGVVRSLT